MWDGTSEEKCDPDHPLPTGAQHCDSKVWALSVLQGRETASLFHILGSAYGSTGPTTDRKGFNELVCVEGAKITGIRVRRETKKVKQGASVSGLNRVGLRPKSAKGSNLSGIEWPTQLWGLA